MNLKTQCLAGVLAACALPALAAPHQLDLTALKRQADAKCADGSFSGIVLLRVDRETAFHHACGDGPITAQSRFKIFSTTKLLTALAVMRLIEQGKMALDAPITRYIPDAPAQWDKVTVHHLLQHTSGLPDATNDLLGAFRAAKGSHAQAMRILLKQPALPTAPQEPPGTKWRYNNFGYELLADAAAHADGRPFDKVLEALVLAPAGMRDAFAELAVPGKELEAVPDSRLAQGFNIEDGKREPAKSYGFVQLGAGAVHATLADMVALDDALANNSIVSAGTWAGMQADRFTVSPTFQYGRGVMISTRHGIEMRGHTGGVNGFTSVFMRFPSRNAALIVLSNLGPDGTSWAQKAVAEALTRG